MSLSAITEQSRLRTNFLSNFVTVTVFAQFEGISKPALQIIVSKLYKVLTVGLCKQFSVKLEIDVNENLIFPLIFIE